MSFYSDASLVMIPSGYKASKVYSAVPTDGAGDLVFTRALDTATRVGPDGLIEKVRTNLVTYSNTFTDAAWTKSNVTATGGQADPNGGTTAFLIQSTNANQPFFSQSYSASARTISVFAKAGTRSSFSIIGNSFNNGAEFNLATATATAAGVGSLAKIEAVGNGYFRCSVFLSTSSVSHFFLTDIAGTGGVIGDNLTFAFAQSETGDIATPYIPTTTAAVSVGMLANVPRLDYLGGGCPKLLLEPQRVNLVNFSEQINNAYWVKTAATITANVAVSPDGFTNADKFAGDNTSGQHIIRHTFFATTALASVVYSFYVKADGITKMGYREDAQTGRNGAFNIATKTTISATAGDSISFEDAANGYVRVSIKTVVGSGGALGLQLFLLDAAYTTGNPNSYSSNVSTAQGVFIYGAQIELGSYPTSYIPTLGAAVTRSADAASKTGISALIGQQEGVIFVDFVYNAVTAGTSASNIINSEKNTNASFFINRIPSTGLCNSGLFISGSIAAGCNGGLITLGQRTKIAYAYKTGSSALFINGVLIVTNAATYTIPASLDDIFLNDPVTFFSFQENVSFNQALLFPTRLTNTQLIELTTP